jgi:hypothetical protein
MDVDEVVEEAVVDDLEEEDEGEYVPAEADEKIPTLPLAPVTTAGSAGDVVAAAAAANLQDGLKGQDVKMQDVS